jgi:hypothetical protein
MSGSHRQEGAITFFGITGIPAWAWRELQNRHRAKSERQEEPDGSEPGKITPAFKSRTET